MPQPLENVLMQKYGLRYADARKIVTESRERLGLSKNSRAWTEELYDDCTSHCGTVVEGEEPDTECTDNPALIVEAKTPATEKSSIEKKLERGGEEEGDDEDVHCYISIPLSKSSLTTSMQPCLRGRFQKATSGLLTPCFDEDDDDDEGYERVDDNDLDSRFDDLKLSNHSLMSENSESSDITELQIQAYCEDLDDDLSGTVHSSVSLQRERASLCPARSASSSYSFKKPVGRLRKPSSSEDTSATECSDFSEDYVLRVVEVPARGVNRNSSDLSLKVTRQRRRSIRRSLKRESKKTIV
mmetsp:Transcript_11320/g.25216  ORF Transcript_11320/g.25216 Transcript_11320/m.25216 type:complete len:299 (+) Transcript_11320:36-932(+)